MTACAYRSLEPVLRERVTELFERRATDAVFVLAARRVTAQRVGRSVAGAAGAVMGGASLLLGGLSFLVSEDTAQRQVRTVAVLVLLAAWPVALVCRSLCGAAARMVLSRRGASDSLSGDPAADLARLQAIDPLRQACDQAMAWERPSVAWPLAGLCLLAPITIHFIVWFVVTLACSDRVDLGEFGTWIGLSAIIVGHAHMALLVCAVRWAFKLRLRATIELGSNATQSSGVALCIAAGVAGIPGVVLLAIPPGLVLITGVLFVPLMYKLAVRALERERLALHEV